MSKAFNIVLLIALVILGIFYFKERNSNLSDKDQDLIKEKKELEKVIDSLEFRLINSKNNYDIVTDSLRREESKIKHIPYEKIKYIDRNLDDAKSVIESTNYMDK